MPFVADDTAAIKYVSSNIPQVVQLSNMQLQLCHVRGWTLRKWRVRVFHCDSGYYLLPCWVISLSSVVLIVALTILFQHVSRVQGPHSLLLYPSHW